MNKKRLNLRLILGRGFKLSKTIFFDGAEDVENERTMIDEKKSNLHDADTAAVPCAVRDRVCGGGAGNLGG